MSCPLCLEPFSDATAKLKCGHQFCTECLLNSVAKNVGTVAGNTRNQCPMCRSIICCSVEPDASISDKIRSFRSNIVELNETIIDMEDVINELELELSQKNNELCKFTTSNISKSVAIFIQRIWRGLEGRRKATRCRFWKRAYQRRIKEKAVSVIKKCWHRYSNRKWLYIFKDLQNRLNNNNSWKNYHQINNNKKVWKLLKDSAVLQSQLVLEKRIYKKYIFRTWKHLRVYSPWKLILLERVYSQTVWKLIQTYAVIKIQKCWKRSNFVITKYNSLYQELAYIDEYEDSDMDTSPDLWDNTYSIIE